MNYFNYFTEIEEHFQRKRGAGILLSPLDWALIDSWREAGIPLEAALRGIDDAFEKFESGRRRDQQRPRALVYCAAAVLAAAAASADAAVGGHAQPTPTMPGDAGLSPQRIGAHLAAAAAAMAACAWLPQASEPAAEIAATLRRLQASLDAESPAPLRLEPLDQVLSALDDKVYALLQQALPVAVLAEARADVARELAPHRRSLRTEQLAMIERQLLQRQLLERAGLRRLSLFYLA